MMFDRMGGAPMQGLVLALGLAAAGLWSLTAQATNIAQNPGFETDAPNIAACGGTFPNGGGCPLSVWTPSGNAGADIADPHTGSLNGFLGTGSLAETLPTVIGATYAITFDLAADSITLQNASLWLATSHVSGFDASLEVSFGAADDSILARKFVTIGALANQYKSSDGDLNLTLTDIATATSTLLTFTGLQPNVSPGTWYLDDISVTCTANCGGAPVPVPEPASLPLLLTALAGWPVIARLRRRGVGL